MNQTDADAFAASWLAAWNAHDLAAIMRHYSEEIVFTSPFIQRILGDPAGTVRGLADLRAYFERGLAAYPELHFVPEAAVPGVNSVVLLYRSVNQLRAAEVMTLDPAGKVIAVAAHYAA